MPPPKQPAAHQVSQAGAGGVTPPPSDIPPGGEVIVEPQKQARSRAPAAGPLVEPVRPVPEGPGEGPPPPRWRVMLRRAAWTCAALVLAGFVTAVAGYVYISRETPTFDSVNDYHPFVVTNVVAADGSVVGQFYRERRTVVTLDKVPKVLREAVISAEDKDFYTHPGFNFIALLRAAVVDAISGRKRLGASTITQQVVKNFFLSPDKRWKRKLKEILLAARLERNLSKDDILFLYLNQINFGRAHYGVEEASLY
ncbi:MAG: transglycosylase domain-containing protein, partial [Deltaproteobacteria bacterium]